MLVVFDYSSCDAYGRENRCISLTEEVNQLSVQQKQQQHLLVREKIVWETGFSVVCVCAVN